MDKIPPNVYCESESRNVGIHNSILIDDDTNQDKQVEEEDEDVDVENVALENENGINKGSQLPFQENEGSNQLSPITEKKIIQKNGLNSKTLGFRKPCGECGASCLNISKHLNGNNRPIYPSLTCGICNLIMPTRCSLKIHLRIHLRAPPYRCPDCGKDFVSWDEVHAHLKFSCGHLAKCVRFLCTCCKGHFPSKGVLGHHITSKHARDVYRCPFTDCNIAFFHKNSLDKHIINNHQSAPGVAIECKQCSLCPKKLVHKDKFHKHIEEHLNSNIVYIYGYKCPMCSIVYANKMAFIIHQIKEKNELDHKDGKKEKKKKTATRSNKIGETIDEEPMVMEEEPQIVKNCSSTYDYTSNEKDPLSLEDWDSSQDQRVQEQREELCIVCKKNSVVILPGISLNDQSLCCKQCVKPLDGNTPFREKSSHKKSKSTVNTTHSNVTPKKRKRSNGSFVDGSPESDMSVELYTDNYPVKKKTKKKGNKNQMGHTGQARIQGKVISSNLLNELVCAKCRFVAEAKDVFFEHITTHRTDPGDYQCLECGLCFVVIPSFEKHLQVHHNVRDVNKYISDNASCLPQKSVPVEEETDDNQCRICHMKFDTLSTLEKHFRTHGMAFMNSLSKSP